MNKNFKIICDGEVSILILALNHYITTGDTIGHVGMLAGKNGEMQALIPCDLSNSVDHADLKLLARKIEYLQPFFHEADVHVQFEDSGVQRDKFRTFILSFHRRDLLIIACALAMESKSIGWGSPKPYVDAYIEADPQSGDTFKRVCAAFTCFFQAEAFIPGGGQN